MISICVYAHIFIFQIPGYTSILVVLVNRDHPILKQTLMGDGVVMGALKTDHLKSAVF